MSEWSVKQVKEWAKEHYGDRNSRVRVQNTVYDCQCTPYMYVEEAVDGDILLMLVTKGSMEQYKACGLATVKDHMKLRKRIICSLSHPPVDAS